MSGHSTPAREFEQHQPPCPGVEYRPIPGFPNYTVGADGTVWRARRRNGVPLPQEQWKRLAFVSHHGPTRYRYVHVNNGPVTRVFGVHRLVLTVFVGPCPKGLEACHYPDRDTSNNRVENLCWGTRAENASHMREQGTHMEGGRHGSAKLSEADIPRVRRLVADGHSMTYVADVFGVTRNAVAWIVKNVTWDHVPEGLDATHDGAAGPD